MNTSSIKEKVEFIVGRVCSGLGNIHCMAPYETTLTGCLDRIIQDQDKSSVFTDTFGFEPNVVKELIPYVPGLNLSDIVIKRFVNDEEEPFTRMIYIDN